MTRLVTKRTQGRVPRKPMPTDWRVSVRDEEWNGTTLRGLHTFLIYANPKPLDRVRMVRNGQVLYDGLWSGIADDPTLW